MGELPWLSRCLSTWDMVIILTNTAGTVLVVFHRGAWVALTVALAAIGNSVIDTWAFRPKVTAYSLLYSALHNALQAWESKGLIGRRSPALFASMVKTAEEGFVSLIAAQDASAASQQASVSNAMSRDSAEKASAP